MLKVNYWILLVLSLTIFWSCQNTSQRILLYSSPDLDYETAQGYNQLVNKLITTNSGAINFDETQDPTQLDENNIQAYDAILFMGANGDELDAYQRADIERYIQAGGNFIGINALSKTDRNWLWYGQLTGFLNKKDTIESFFITRINDQGQNIEHLSDDHSNSQSYAWDFDYDGGKSLQFSLPDLKALTDLDLQSITQRIQSQLESTTLDYSKATTDRVPEENRFTKHVLTTNLYEPMELDILPDGKVIWVERRGGIRLYDPSTEKVDTIAEMPVHTKFEDGLMGIAIDPNYEQNNWIYMYYSPVGEEPIQHLSRFVFKDRKIDFDSEKVVLVVDVQRDECCHSGGSVEFGPDGLLYLSTGDDTNPFASNGFSPIDERPGRSPWDAQKSSANTNDLRGKILRIKPETDGTYSIPDGNLFPEGTPNTRPEIYVMGCRNPFRISIDSRTNFLYWGDVGPDSGKDNPERGPRGIDEINQARHAGFWGWPLTRGNNIVYHDYDFSKGKPGPPFIADNLINDSPNNTGLTRLPPAQKSMIWYSYGASDEFPWVDKGGKNPMAGPIYYSEDFEGENKFPEYFDGKLIAYEWMRHWLYIVTMDENHNYLKAEPFMPNTEFSRPMDMVFDKSGKLYLLEYGDKWFAQNEEAVLSVIEYNGGNRAPIARLSAENKYGGVPFLAKLSAANSSDYDNDELSYSWKVDGNSVAGSDKTLEINLEDAGEYLVEVEVKDPSGVSNSATYTLYAGNAAPQVNWSIEGNQSFFWPGREVSYKVEVNDEEDGNQIAEDRLKIAFDYLPLGEDITEIAQGHAAQMTTAQIALGEALMEKSDCKVCHAINQKIAGPSYHEIAKFYEKKPDATPYLAKKIMEGGGGVWGETVMAAHPDLTVEQATAMATYVLSLTDLNKAQEKIAQSGTYELDGADETGQYILWSAYTDGGNNDLEPITVEDKIKLRYHRLQAENYDEKSKPVSIGNFKGDGKYLSGFRHGDHFGFKNIDLTEIKAIRMKIRCGRSGGTLEFYTDSLKSKLFESQDFNCEEGTFSFIQFDVNSIDGFHDLYFKTTNESAKSEWIGAVDWLEFIVGEKREL